MKLLNNANYKNGIHSSVITKCNDIDTVKMLFCFHSIILREMGFHSSSTHSFYSC